MELTRAQELIIRLKKVKIEHVDGCHVQKSRSIDNDWYIVPLCDSCNQKKGELDIEDTKLAKVVYKY